MDNLGCTGSEASLFDCKYVFPRGDTHNEDIGVRCFNTTSECSNKYFMSDICLECQRFPSSNVHFMF